MTYRLTILMRHCPKDVAMLIRSYLPQKQRLNRTYFLYWLGSICVFVPIYTCLLCWISKSCSQFCRSLPKTCSGCGLPNLRRQSWISPCSTSLTRFRSKTMAKPWNLRTIGIDDVDSGTKLEFYQGLLLVKRVEGCDARPFVVSSRTRNTNVSILWCLRFAGGTRV